MEKHTGRTGEPVPPTFDKPLFVLDRKGNTIENNMAEFWAWRERQDPEGFKASIDELARARARPSSIRNYPPASPPSARSTKPSSTSRFSAVDVARPPSTVIAIGASIS